MTYSIMPADIRCSCRSRVVYSRWDRWIRLIDHTALGALEQEVPLLKSRARFRWAASLAECFTGDVRIEELLKLHYLARIERHEMDKVRLIHLACRDGTTAHEAGNGD